MKKYSFWTDISDPPEGIGYGVFTLKHLILVLCSVIMIAAIVRIYKKSDDARRIVIRRCIAAALIVSECLKYTLIYIQGTDIIQYLPLEVCSFAAYAIICDSIWTDNKFLPEMLVTIFMPGAIMQHISPSTAVLPAWSYFTINQFFFHGLIIAYILARFLNGEIHLRYRGVWESAAKFCVIAAGVYILDSIIGTNFMYLKDHEGVFLLKVIADASGDGMRYTLGLILFTIAAVHVFYGIFRTIELIIARKSA